MDPRSAALQQKSESTILFFAPFVSSTMRAEPGWIDYNGHMNMAYFHVLFDRALEEAWSVIGIGGDYAAERGMSTFAAEAHVVYRREIGLIDPVRVTIQLVEHDDKRLHVYAEMRHAREGWLAATAETMHLHVDLETRKVIPFPPEVLANLAAMKAAHGRLPRPTECGRVIGMRAPASAASRSGRLN